MERKYDRGTSDELNSLSRDSEIPRLKRNFVNDFNEFNIVIGHLVDVVDRIDFSGTY